MRCPKCQTENPDDSKFCKECASSLTGEAIGQPGFTKTLESPALVLNPGDVMSERYEILEKLGEGGMGEVYRALDRSLDRQIAVKVLPAAFAEDAERLARFEREAKLLAVLNHPNIAAIYGLERFEGQRFLVLELAEGETLKTKLDRAPFDVEEALDICRQITEGLEAAHDKGIIHRDLKPANIMVTPDGGAKILDFGLAKAFAEETTGVGTDVEKSPTITAQMTKPGVVLGTAAYMSPEQARGRSVDKRTDIWAFGCVLFECLTGQRAFQGETVSDTLAHILKGEPDWSALPANTPSSIRTLLRRCLRKNQKDRLHDIADARIEIAEAGAPGAEGCPARRRLPLAFVLAAGAALFAVGFFIRPLIWKAQPTHESVLRTGPAASIIKLETGYGLDGRRGLLEYSRPSLNALTFSRDGDFIVYCAVNDAAQEDAKPQLFLRRIDELEARPIEGTEGGVAPFLSPDGRWAGFWVEGRLKKVPIDGGVAQDLCEARDLGSGWGRDDRIVFADIDDGLSVIPASGGEPETLTIPDKTAGENNHRLPSCLPDARGVLFTVMRSSTDENPSDTDQNPKVFLFDFKTRKQQHLLDDASDARYVPTGHIVFLRRGVLWAVPFSLDNLEISGEEVPVRSDVMQAQSATGNNTTLGQYSFSASGDLIYAPGGVVPDWKNSLAWVDFQGNDEPASSNLDQHFMPSLSPDGGKIAYQTIYTRRHIWICDIKRDLPYPVVDEGRNWYPIWTPDGKKVIYGHRISDQSFGVFMKAVDGSSPQEELLVYPKSDFTYLPSSISPDGTRLALTASRQDQNDIVIFHIPSKDITPFRASEFSEEDAGFSPDGRWIVYSSDKEGQFEVYVAPSSGSGGEIKISRGGGDEPGWSRNGKRIFYRSPTRMWVVDIQTEPDFSPGRPRLLFQSMKFGGGGGKRCWDISLDDQKFLMVRREERPSRPVTEFILIQNWFEELERLVPTGK